VIARAGTQSDDAAGVADEPEEAVVVGDRATIRQQTIEDVDACAGQGPREGVRDSALHLSLDARDR
jgi:hypothetical protein